MRRAFVRRGLLRRYLLPSVIAFVGLIAVVMFLSLGRILHEEDPLEHADVIFVLGGAHLDRAAEAGHLYLEGGRRGSYCLLTRPMRRSWRCSGAA